MHFRLALPFTLFYKRRQHQAILSLLVNNNIEEKRIITLPALD